MWRDPLDELIEDLDQVVTPAPAGHRLVPLEELLKVTDRIYHLARRHRGGVPPEDPKLDHLIAQVFGPSGLAGSPPGPRPHEPTSDLSAHPTESRPRVPSAGRDRSPT